MLSVAKAFDAMGGNANPHLWFDIPRVQLVAQSIVTEPKVIADANVFDGSLQALLAVIETTKSKYPHAPVETTASARVQLPAAEA